VVGMQATLQPADQVITTYRDHGPTCWLAGMENPPAVMAEGSQAARPAYSKGPRAASMHMFSREKNFFGRTMAIVGRQCADRQRAWPSAKPLIAGEWARSVSPIFGDGAAANQGQVVRGPFKHGRKLWKLPVV